MNVWLGKSAFDNGCGPVQVSADGEVELYKACHQAGITMLSIGHRPAIRGFHDLIVHFEGAQHGRGWHMEDLRSGQILRESPEEEGI